eukprot:gnl/Dysnectes_brevis/2590_a3126_1196.p1 GENE.gnl/Dysnectes_brevis/2590_a3126_1196~~gnl/Dysnectes_brevis/2590_a3126_1196.p1  ORF type:complete len:394 (-),score=115.13 gnl/Dysnectes_brevis/2590_a3126_1196:38-1219(-)
MYSETTLEFTATHILCSHNNIFFHCGNTMPNANLDILRYLNREDFRVLTAVELGMRNHQYVPMALIVSISQLKHVNVPLITNNLLRHKLLQHVGGSGEGYCLSSTGYDYLALNVMLQRGVIVEIGSKVGVGKEADVYMAIDPEGNHLVLKFHKLGRQSFKTAKTKRDYLEHRKNAGWLLMSRLAALREFGFMQALHERGFPTPLPISVNRNCVAMAQAPGRILSSYRTAPVGGMAVAERIHGLMVELLGYGVVHGDFNEFNILFDETDGKISVIDYPQMVPVESELAEMYFDRDVECIERFFERHLRTEVRLPRFAALMPQVEMAKRIETTETPAEGPDEATAYRAPKKVKRKSKPRVDVKSQVKRSLAKRSRSGKQKGGKKRQKSDVGRDEF